MLRCRAQIAGAALFLKGMDASRLDETGKLLLRRKNCRRIFSGEEVNRVTGIDG
jgi:hypothetical protein